MGWNSSGVTISSIGAFKKAVLQMTGEPGIFICGGRGKHARNTPAESHRISDQKGLDGDALAGQAG